MRVSKATPAQYQQCFALLLKKAEKELCSIQILDYFAHGKCLCISLSCLDCALANIEPCTTSFCIVFVSLTEYSLTRDPREASAFIIPFDIGVHSSIDHETGRKRKASPHAWFAKQLLEDSVSSGSVRITVMLMYYHVRA